MCRFVVLRCKGDSMLLADVVTRPEHSIIRQSFDSRERRETTFLPGRLNADGFGLGWYTPNRTPKLPSSEQPCVFSSILPAWNNRNLHRICEMIESDLLFAHVRAAGFGSAVTEANCHPFVKSRYMWMHNGHIAGFDSIKRALLVKLHDEAFKSIQGTTDSEHAFALFLDQVLLEAARIHKSDSEQSLFEVKLPAQTLMRCMVNTIVAIRQLLRDQGIKQHSFLNFAATDGETIVVSRITIDEHSQHKKQGASMYYTSGTAFVPSQSSGHYRITHRDVQENVVLVASERLTRSKEDWVEVPDEHLLIIRKELTVLLVPFAAIDPQIETEM